MKQFAFLVITAALTMSPVLAQSGAAANPIVNSSKGVYVILRTNVLRAAEKMPEENYAFQPTPEVRTFGRLVAHVADGDYEFCSQASGKKDPGLDVEKTTKSKAEIIEALKASFAYCDAVFDTMTDASAAQPVKFFGRPLAKIALLEINTAHVNEHYGNMVTYMRIKGLVPPSSEQQPSR